MWRLGFEFWLPGRAVGKGRPRGTIRGGRVAMYTPGKTVRAESGVRVLARAAMARAGFELTQRAVKLEIEAVRQPPKGWTKRKTADAIACRGWDDAKPDLDNVVKLIGDALNNVAYLDDGQIVALAACKRFGPVTGCLARVWHWTPPEGA